MFYNEVMLDLANYIRNYLDTFYVLDGINSNVLVFYVMENIKGFIGNVALTSSDIDCSVEGNTLVIKTIFDRKVRLVLNRDSLYALEIDGECLNEKDEVIETCILYRSLDKIVNKCTFNEKRSVREYVTDLARCDFSLAEGDEGKDEKEFVIKASPIGSKISGNYLYELERIQPKPDKENGSILKKFVDLVSNDSIMRIPVRDLADDYDIDVLFSVFSKLKDEVNLKRTKDKMKQKTN